MNNEAQTKVRVTVESVTLSTGVRDQELAWTGEFDPTGGVPAITRKAALQWWSDTDQAGPCKVRFGLEFPGGGRHWASCRVGPTIAVSDMQTRVVKP